MGNSNYARGAAFERTVKAHLESRGYYAVRAAGSHGLTDVLALDARRTLFIQCKTGKATMSTADRLKLYSEAFKVGAIALLAQPGTDRIVYQMIGYDGQLLPWAV